MNLNRVRKGLLLLIAILWNVYLFSFIETGVQRINCFPDETAWENFKAQTLTEETVEAFYMASDGEMKQMCELLTMYYATDNTCADIEILQNDIAYVKEYQPEKFEKLYTAVYSVWEGLSHFPVGAIDNLPDADVSFTNSWAYERTYGGERVHEGTDIMASVNKRGIYPVYSATDGVIENIGWLRLGGYRIGIRSNAGAYFYYAHMAEYAKDFEIGEEIKAGTLLGYMGDTGYSDTEGTTGKFDVHLHFGIYLNDENGDEFAINPYPELLYLWNYGINELYEE